MRRYMKYIVVYCGAPYQEGDAGEIVSRHHTFAKAKESRDKLQGTPKYYGANSKIMVLTPDGDYRTEWNQ